MSKLFEPLTVGTAQLQNRCVLAPLTRYRCDDDWVPLPMAKGSQADSLASCCMMQY